MILDSTILFLSNMVVPMLFFTVALALHHLIKEKPE
jgi:hypothetical protein